MATVATPAASQSVLDRAVELIGGHFFSYANEEQLQAGIAELLGRESDWVVTREVRLGSQAERIDLVVGQLPTRVGIEVKVDGSAQSVRRQLLRYSKTGKVDQLILVTNRVSHSRGLRDWTTNGLPNAVPLTVVRARWLR